MEIIDAHAHIYPEKIAKKATDAIGEFYDIQMEMPAGTTDQLIEDGSRAGITRYIVHSVATTAHQVRSINEFIKKEADLHKEFIPFMTLHQDLTEEQTASEIEWAKNNAFKGIKLHPDFQKFNIDDEIAQKFYKHAGENFPILLHVGDDRFDFSSPERLIKTAKKYPKVTFIAAHFGGYRKWNDAEEYKGLNNVYFDTCSSLPFITPKKAKEIIDMLGADKFFFGTDFPMWDAKEELNRFNQIDLTNEEKEKILSLNIKRVLGV